MSIHLNKDGKPVENRLPEVLTDALSDTEDQRVLVEALTTYALTKAPMSDSGSRSDMQRAQRLARLIGSIELPEVV